MTRAQFNHHYDRVVQALNISLGRDKSARYNLNWMDYMLVRTVLYFRGLLWINGPHRRQLYRIYREAMVGDNNRLDPHLVARFRAVVEAALGRKVEDLEDEYRASQGLPPLV